MRDGCYCLVRGFFFSFPSYCTRLFSQNVNLLPAGTKELTDDIKN